MTQIGYDDFLNNGPSGPSGGETKYLRDKDWKKLGKLELVFHQSPMHAVWRHPWKRVVELKREDGSKEYAVWSDQFVSWEPPAVNQRQFLRDRTTGRRETPPTICPMGMFLNRTQELVDSGKVDFAQELFRFEAGRESESLFAGGVINRFGGARMTKEEAEAMRAAGVAAKDSYRHKCMAKLWYIFQLVDINNVQAGLQIARVTTAVGDATRKAIHSYKMQLDESEAHLANFIKTPYVIRWIYDENAKSFSDYYSAVVLPRIVVDEDVRNIVSGDGYDLTAQTRPGNPLKLREQMENHYVGPAGLYDWDALFAPSTEQWISKYASAEDDRPTAESVGEYAPAPAPVVQVPEQPKPKAPKAKKAKAETGAEVKRWPDRIVPADKRATCGHCSNVIHEDEDVCPVCGYDYVDEDTPDPAPWTGGLVGRVLTPEEAAAEKPSAPKAKKAKAPKVEAKAEAKAPAAEMTADLGNDEPEDDGDDLGF